jgi:hypothetical protein
MELRELQELLREADESCRHCGSYSLYSAHESGIGAIAICHMCGHEHFFQKVLPNVPANLE